MQKRFHTIALIGKYQSAEVRALLLKLAHLLRERNLTPLLDTDTARNIGHTHLLSTDLVQIGQQADLAIIVGGDGTMLNIARQLSGSNVPLLGINQGRLGFLTDISAKQTDKVVNAILDGEYDIERRFLLDVTIKRGRHKLYHGCALNDVTLNRGSSGRLIEYEIEVDGQYVYCQRSDGVVVATPTGSTAYALSAGGPILHPSLSAVAIVPICPHTLTDRPIVINSAAHIRILLNSGDGAVVHVDGQIHLDVVDGDCLFIHRSRHMVTFLHPKGTNHYDTLREKLHWGQKL
ncbi:MAG TPA: NAD kinase [Burkholderiales bacterium]|nr:NAD kinase [Burkholderiales bacterium]